MVQPFATRLLIWIFCRVAAKSGNSTSTDGQSDGGTRLGQAEPARAARAPRPASTCPTLRGRPGFCRQKTLNRPRAWTPGGEREAGYDRQEQRDHRDAKQKKPDNFLHGRGLGQPAWAQVARLELEIFGSKIEGASLLAMDKRIGPEKPSIACPSTGSGP